MLKFLHTTPTFPLATALVGAALVVSWLLPTPAQAQGGRVAPVQDLVSAASPPAAPAKAA